MWKAVGEGTKNVARAEVHPHLRNAFPSGYHTPSQPLQTPSASIGLR